MSKSNYKVYNGKSLKKALENSRLYFLVIMFIVGLFSGAYAIKSDTELINKVSTIISEYTNFRAEQGIVTNFCNSLSVNCIFVFFNLFLGFSLIGYPFLICLPFIKGLGTGLVSGYLYYTYKFIGFGYSALMIYPAAIVSTFAIILACNDSCEYSKNAYMKSLKNRGQYEKDETRVYLTRQLVFSGICVASAVIDSVFNGLFSRFFEI